MPDVSITIQKSTILEVRKDVNVKELQQKCHSIK